MSDKILLPMIPTTLSMLAVNKVKEFVKKNKYDLKKFFTFFSMVETRKKLHAFVMNEYNDINKRALNSFIPYSSDIEKMGIYREPLMAKYPRVKTSQSFLALWEEIKKKVGF